MPENLDAKEGRWKVFDFEVALKVIQHISTGIYKSAGGVLKELVSNSYDSQARTVQITTDYPKVGIVRIVDDGWGMREEVLKEQFSHIGASLRHREPALFEAEDEEPPDSRQIIGMFGVGFLSAAHISKTIKLVTYPRGEKYGLQAEFNLRPYFEYATQVEPLDKFIGGTIRYKRIDPGGVGTTLDLQPVDADSPFRRFLLEPGMDLIDWPESGKSEAIPGKGVSDVVEGIGSRPIRTIDQLRGRERVLWELGLMAPVHYLPNGPISSEVLGGDARRVVEDIVNSVNNLDFRVFLDGVEVLKPIRLPTPKTASSKWDRLDTSAGEDLHVFPIDIDASKKSGNRVRAKGYLLFQPWRIVPQELTGIYPRVSGVGVGSYDSRFFRALRSESPIVRVQLSGELYVSKGLANALTLDRSTFNEQDPQFIALREAVVSRISLSDGSIIEEVRTIRDRRGRRRRAIKNETERDEDRKEVERAVKRTSPRRQTSFETASKLRQGSSLFDYDEVSAYPSPARPWLVIDHKTNAVRVGEELEGEARVVSLLLLFDSLLGELENAAEWRMKLVEKLAEVL
jgi:hypothetical protein